VTAERHTSVTIGALPIVCLTEATFLTLKKIFLKDSEFLVKKQVQ